MNSSELKKYPFLGNILKLYGTLDNPVVEDDQNQKISNICDKHNTFNPSLTINQKNTCKKLLKNLLLYKNTNDGDYEKGCSKLYVWLYFEIMKCMISNDIIEKIFELPNSIENEGPRYNYCPYSSFNDKIHNPENLMKLRIFNDNTETFQNMLMDKVKPKDCYLQKYIYKCINIYNEMHKNYCLGEIGLNHPNKDACDIVNNFNENYSNIFPKLYDSTYKLPSLSDEITTYIIKCPLDEQEQELSSINYNQSDNSILLSVSKVLGTMTGVPFLLVLLYKFSPAGKKIHSRIRGRLNKNMYAEGSEELLFDKNKHNESNSYNIGYETS